MFFKLGFVFIFAPIYDISAIDNHTDNHPDKFLGIGAAWCVGPVPQPLSNLPVIHGIFATNDCADEGADIHKDNFVGLGVPGTWVRTSF